ncbi:hypothetical protein BSL78_14969 [Apostichopus japonicus]|uniref:Uncharacterized protein n=1 Tax=Stichopus japonicus TaxID=307972 RepID=A0A2G8KJN2_STIJA|nr:hypothetical protein BSL78_14969 [Apostichopus japonicus]
MNGSQIKAVIDTGSAVTLLSTARFLTLFAGKSLAELRWLGLKAVNQTRIPFLGYFETDVKVGGEMILVVEDDQDPPLLLGMNIIHRIPGEILVDMLGYKMDESKLSKPVYTLARIPGKHKVKLPARSVQVVNVSCPVHASATEVMIEPVSQLPKHLIPFFLFVFVIDLGRSDILEFLNVHKHFGHDWNQLSKTNVMNEVNKSKKMTNQREIDWQ